MLYPTVEDFRRTGITWRWPNFSPEELACTCKGRLCGSNLGGGNYFHDENFLDKLQQLRSAHDGPLKITSGHRCTRRNKEVGGARASRHLVIAADISITGMTLKQRRDLLHSARKIGFSGLGKSKTFLHVDTRPGQTEWFYTGAASEW